MHFAYISDTLDSLRERDAVARHGTVGQGFESLPVRQKRVLLLSVSAGFGHIRAAEAIRTCIERHHPDVIAMHIDVMDFVPRIFRSIYTDFYITLVARFPTIWGLLYRGMDTASSGGIARKIRLGIQRLNTVKLLKEIALIDPDAIICTHFLPAELLSSLAKAGDLHHPVWVQVTDFDLHRIWVHQGMAGYFSASKEVAFRMRAQGISSQSIHCTGIPVMPAFSEALDRKQCAREFGLDPERMTLLLMGGGAGIGKLDETAENLLAMDADFQLVVLTGKNEKLLRALHILSNRFPGRLMPQGYTTRMERLMACADVAITKPGGLTTAECLAVGLPMIVHSAIPGQEERNADFLLEQGAALKACDAETLEYKVRFLLESPAKLADMRAKAKSLGRPSAAESVASIVLRNC